MVCKGWCHILFIFIFLITFLSMLVVALLMGVFFPWMLEMTMLSNFFINPFSVDCKGF